MGGGRRSSVISGVIVNKDRVRKSSGWTDGEAKVDTVWAADLMARSEAVRLDLNVDPKRGNDRDEGAGDFEQFESVVVNWGSMMASSSSEGSLSSKGWSNAQFSHCDQRRYRRSEGLREGVSDSE